MDRSQKPGLLLTVCRRLHGIPILIKNNIATADKMNNTGMSPLPLSAFTTNTSQLVAMRY